MEKIDFIFFKILGIYSLILGGLCAIFSLIPSLMPFFTLFFMPFLGGYIPLILLIQKNGFSPSENKTFAIFGGLSGLMICAGFLVVFVPLVGVIHLINKNYYDYGIQNLNLFLFCLFFIMISVVYITSNAVVGLIVGGIYTYFKGRKNG